MLTELYPVKSHRITAFSACQVCVQCLMSKLVSTSPDIVPRWANDGR